MDIYITSIKQWAKIFIKEPHYIMLVSISFVLLSLPIFSMGIAAALCVYFSSMVIEGKGINIKDDLSYFARHYLVKAIMLGLIDLSAILLCIGSLMMIADTHVSIVVKYPYAIFLILDLFFLLSFVYQYPLMIYNGYGLKDVLSKSIIVCFNNFFTTMLILCAVGTLLIISVLTGVGIILFFSGGTFFLMVYTYKNIVKGHSPVSSL